MRKTFMAWVLAAGLVVAGSGQAVELHSHNGNCGYSSDYDVTVMPDGIGFRRDTGHPGDVFMHEGRLRVDGHDVTVSADDAGRLRDYETQVRSLLPEVAEIAREGVNIGYAAMRTVLLTFAENDAERREMVGRLDRNHRDALARIDAGLGKGKWRPHDMDDVIETGVEQSVSDIAGKVTGAAVTAALSGDQSKVAALQARAESLNKTIDHEVNSRADDLDRRAQALCPRLSALEKLQQQFQFRLQDGAHLQLLKRDGSDNKKLVTAADPARAE